LVVNPAARATGSKAGVHAASGIQTGPAIPGAQVWAQRYKGRANGDDYARALGVSPDGSTVIVTGQSSGSTSGPDYTTVAYGASTGARLWARRYNGPANSTDAASALGVSPDGTTVFVTGGSTGQTSGYDYATVAYSASTGARVWARRYNGPANRDDFATALGLSPDGTTAFVTGVSVGQTSGADYATLAYNASTGARLWARRYNGPGNGDDYVTALGMSPDGSTVFVTGYSNGQTSGYDYGTVAYSASAGTRLWVRRHNGPGNGGDIAYALGVSPDGSTVFVTGYIGGQASGPDYGTVAYSTSTGARLWARRYNGPGNGYDYASALGLSADGTTVFVTGVSTGLRSSADYATVAYNASTGGELWLRRYNGPGNGYDLPTALGVSADGTTVFVTGYSVGQTSGADYTTLAYGASTGARLWARRYNGPGNGFDYVTALGLSPDGTTLYVTGYSVGRTGGYDYATVAYGIV